MSGAGFLCVAKRIFPRPPRPPLATTTSCPSSNKSAIKAFVSAFLTIVPGGTLTIKSSAPRPYILLLMPFSPGFALK